MHHTSLSKFSWQKYKQALQVRFGPLDDVRIPRTATWSFLGPTQSVLSATDTMRDVTEKNKEIKMSADRHKFPSYECVSDF